MPIGRRTSRRARVAITGMTAVALLWHPSIAQAVQCSVSPDRAALDLFSELEYATRKSKPIMALPDYERLFSEDFRKTTPIAHFWTLYANEQIKYGIDGKDRPIKERIAGVPYMAPIGDDNSVFVGVPVLTPTGLAAYKVALKCEKDVWKAQSVGLGPVDPPQRQSLDPPKPR